MFKTLAFSAALLLCGPFSSFVSAQSATNHATNRTVSSQDKAEAKRLYKEGVKYGQAGLFAQAVEILQRSTKLDPGNADAHYALGHAYYDLKQWRNAIESLKIAVALNPNDDEARDRLGLARAMLWEQETVRIAAERRTPPPHPVAQTVAMNAKTSAQPEKAAEKPTEKPIENAAAPAPRRPGSSGDSAHEDLSSWTSRRPRYSNQRQRCITINAVHDHSGRISGTPDAR